MRILKIFLKFNLFGSFKYYYNLTKISLIYNKPKSLNQGSAPDPLNLIKIKIYFSPEIDGKITDINIKRSETTSFANSRELIKCNVIRETEFESNEVYRTFEEFCELYNVLSKTFTTLRLSETPSYSKFKEEKKFFKRYLLVEKLLKEIMSLPAEISQSEIIYTFFHPILRDKKQEAFYSTDSENVLALNNEQFFENNNLHELDIKGEVKLKLRLKDNKFFVNCLQCRNLKPPFNQSISSLKPYVKCYLRPDYTKSTKKKVQALFNGANPIFTETMEYDISLEELKKRTLELSVLNNRINIKEKIGSIEIKLADINWQNEYRKKNRDN
ncbi:phosphatidylinositol 4-phosphate 3-kinase C2 domain-containing subunit beta isoform X1 [Brachionus plicatilis]|uniref:Phosphatidylinositol 4-phosphate 3-kinase C2 domain-containing subunit beta isoform X1 n=1 Tax=Brachionus plicatilis TaxID=10195 RepID=A0A3M7R9C1_BRAPC|nr:phosphatidylinositol 4-phosphate 3-kinase C2 domain-containing subunit beta isoform X1 [Brachionus plicatilis]